MGDYDRITKDDFLGQISFEIKGILESEVNGWFQLKSRKGGPSKIYLGEIRVHIKYQQRKYTTSQTKRRDELDVLELSPRKMCGLWISEKDPDSINIVELGSYVRYRLQIGNPESTEIEKIKPTDLYISNISARGKCQLNWKGRINKKNRSYVFINENKEEYVINEEETKTVNKSKFEDGFVLVWYCGEQEIRWVKKYEVCKCYDYQKYDEFDYTNQDDMNAQHQNRMLIQKEESKLIHAKIQLRCPQMHGLEIMVTKETTKCGKCERDSAPGTIIH